MDKLLLLGNNTHVDELIKFAKERNVYTIVTDNLPIENSPEKAMADEAWDISVTDTDTLAKRCKEEGVTAVLCGASEVCLNATRELCKKAGYKFYAEDKAWDITNDKLEFKKACIESGLDVPKAYKLDLNFLEEDLNTIEYPVVVKPTDGFSSIGLHICSDRQELIEGYKDAYDKSLSHKVVVEECIIGEQLGLIYTISNGVATLVMSGDDVADSNNNQRRVFGFTPTKHFDLYKEKLEKPILKLFENLGCREGIGCLQIITNGEKYAVIEMNYRLPGGKNPAESYMCNNLLDFVLEEKKNLIFDEKATRTAYGYVIWLKPGVIGNIEGIEKVKELIPGIVLQPMKQIGSTVESDTGMRQVFAFALFSCNMDQYDDYIDTINKNLIITSENGEDMIDHYIYDRSGLAVLEG